MKWKQWCHSLLTLSLTILLAGSGSALAQKDAAGTADEHTPYTLSVRSQLVQLDVVVRDTQGNLVRNLKPEDFSVLENGVPQKIVSFSNTVPPSSTSGAVVPIDSTAELDRREPDAPVTILVLDEISSSFADEYFARYSMERYLAKQGDTLDQPMTLIARTIDRTLLLCDYTTSKKKILDALNRHIAGNDWKNSNPNFQDVAVGAAFASLLEVAKATQGHPGHKNLIWIGRGFPAMQWADLNESDAERLQTAVSQCVDVLRTARITLYAIDPAGVTAPSNTTDDSGTLYDDDPFHGAIDFDTMATDTGGAALHGRNDVDHLIGDAVADGESFYTLAYRPTSATGDPKEFRNIKIVLKDPTMVAINRTGYFPSLKDDALGDDATGAMSHASVMDLASAASSLVVFDGIPLVISQPDASSGQIHVSFPASAIGLEESDGKLKADITLIALSYESNGKLLGKDGRVVTLHLAPLDGTTPESRTVQIATTLDAKPPVARVRVVVRSNANGKVGAANLYLVDPATLKDHATGLKPRK